MDTTETSVHKILIELEESVREECDALLAGEKDSGVGDAERIYARNVRFAGGNLQFSAMLTEADPTPYIDPVLFDVERREDHDVLREIGPAEPIWELPAEREFDLDQTRIIIQIQ